MSSPAKTQNIVTINTAEVQEQIRALNEAFQAIDVGLRKKYMGAAVRKAIRPAFRSFKSKIPVGPTGNLKRSAAMVARKYEYVSVALCGYAMAHGSDEQAKGWHQGLIEYGTRGPRVIRNSKVASSYDTRGPFVVQKGVGIKTEPPYPMAFLKGGKGTQPLTVGPAPKGGVRGVSPLDASWSETESQCKTILVSELASGFDKAVSEQLRRIRRGAR